MLGSQRDSGPDWERQAVRKAARMRRARRRVDRSLHLLSRVGVLSWLFVTPVVLAGFSAHLLLRESEHRWLALPLLLLGVIIGAALVRRRIQVLLEEEDDDGS